MKENGKFVHVTHWLAVSYHTNDKQKLRWAWTISKKVGNAVTRNRLKRWGRDFVREFSENDIDINFIFKTKESNFYSELSRDEFNSAFDKVFSKVLS